MENCYWCFTGENPINLPKEWNPLAPNGCCEEHMRINASLPPIRLNPNAYKAPNTEN